MACIGTVNVTELTTISGAVLSLTRNGGFSIVLPKKSYLSPAHSLSEAPVDKK